MSVGCSLVFAMALTKMLPFPAENTVFVIGTFYQFSALVVAAWQFNNLDRAVFTGPGFWRMFPPRAVVVAAVGASTSILTARGEATVRQTASTTEERLEELERQLEQMQERVSRYRRETNEEITQARREFKTSLQEVRGGLTRVDDRVREAALGDDIGWVYGMFFVGALSTFMTAFPRQVGSLFGG
jgi:hypothetical protein